MIIDIHAHLAYTHIFPKHFISDMFLGLSENERTKLEKILPMFMKDKNGSAFINQMDMAGINKAVLLIVDAGVRLGESKLSLDEIYELHYEILKKNSDRIIVFAGIDPRRGEKGFNLFKKGIFEFGFKGLKLYPPMGFAIDDERLNPYYEICSAYRLPVITHTGSSLSYLDNHYADPIFIKNVANRFKDVIFILAHAANNITPKIIELVKECDNIYLDMAGLNSKYNLDNYCSIFDENINDKVLFGSDWPLFNLLHPINRDIMLLKKSFENIRQPNDRALDNIFYKNAIKILSINKI